MLRSFVVALAWLIVLPSSSTLLGQEEKPPASELLRRVKGQVLTSTKTPAVRLIFAKEFTYVGAQSFILYNVAQAEQHFFVDADDKGRVRRLYWVQFEGYLPNNTNTYRYQARKTVKLGGLEFIADAFVRNLKASPGRPDSDGSRAQKFLADKGYQMASNDVLSQRLVHLTDETKRNELMIIYMEDLSPLGLTAADLAPQGKAAALREKILQELLDRAVKGMDVAK